jgi:hypothetical protein
VIPARSSAQKHREGDGRSYFRDVQDGGFYRAPCEVIDPGRNAALVLSCEMDDIVIKGLYAVSESEVIFFTRSSYIRVFQYCPW